MRMPRPFPHSPRAKPGITLLEVLISCGLLLVGLSTMAALLPAAGSRFAQASLEDRAGFLTANAMAELTNRGLLRADSFPPSGKTLAFGSLLGQIPAYGSLPGGGSTADWFAELSEVGTRRCGSPRTFVLEDDLVYTSPEFLDTPSNAFGDDGGPPGPRQFREGICWGATLAADAFPESGAAALLSIAIFKKDGHLEQGTLGEGVAIVLRRNNSFYESDLTSSGSLLRACSWVLAVPATSPTHPRWFQVMSSWESSPAEGQITRLILRDQDEFQTLTATPASGTTATVFAFEGLIRVDEHRVTLQ